MRPSIRGNSSQLGVSSSTESGRVVHESSAALFFPLRYRPVAHKIWQLKIYPAMSIKIFYPHIYKTAGQSLIAAVREHIPNDRCLDVTPEKSAAEFLALPDTEKISRYDFVYGHVDAAFCPALLGEFRLLTFLRDPISRAVSHYNYAMSERSNAGHLRLQQENWSFDRFIDEYMDDWNGNLQTRVLAGTAWGASAKLSAGESLDLALQNLEKSLVVGILEYFDVSIGVLASYTGWDIKHSRKNATVEKKINAVSTQQRQKLYRETWADQILYRKAFERLIGQVSGVYPTAV